MNNGSRYSYLMFIISFILVYKHPFRTLNVNFDLNVGESEFTSEGQSKNINAMLWWTLRHKKDVFKNNR